MRYLLLLLLAGCTTVTTETGSPFVSIEALLAKDLRGADYNAQGYIRTNKLKPNDPVAGCLRDAMVEFGLDDIPGDDPTFQPKHDGAMSEAVIGYVREEEISALVGKVRSGESVNCDAVLGKLWRLRMRGIRAAASLGSLFK